MDDLKRLVFPVTLALLLHGLVISYQFQEHQRLKPALNGNPIKIKMNTLSPKPIVEKKMEHETIEPRVVEAEPVKPVKKIIAPDLIPLEKSVSEVVVIASHQRKVIIKPKPQPNVEISKEKNLSEPPPEKFEHKRVEDQSAPQIEAVNFSSEPEEILPEREVAIAKIQKKAVPIYRQNKQPPYPVMAKRRGYRGEVLLHVLVDKDGAVSKLQVKKSSDHVILDRAALKAVKDWLFTPAIEGGKPVVMWVDVPIAFQLK